MTLTLRLTLNSVNNVSISKITSVLSAYIILVIPEIVVKIVVINGADAIKIVFNKPTVEAKILCSTADTSAFAKKEELGGSILNSTRAGFSQALDVSAYSLLAVAKAGANILNNPASIVTLTYMGSDRALPNYNTMGIAKAALESSVRYLARDLGQVGLRVNAISAGAMKTLAVSGIKGHADLLKISQSETVDGVNVTKEKEGNTCAFLMSDLATGLTGDVIFVDKGVHLR